MSFRHRRPFVIVGPAAPRYGEACCATYEEAVDKARKLVEDGATSVLYVTRMTARISSHAVVVEPVE